MRRRLSGVQAGLVSLALTSPACHDYAGDSTTGFLSVDVVEVIVAESEPLQVSVRVKAWVDACTVLGTISQSRDGNVITITITTKRTSEVCIQLAVRIDETIRLDGLFPPGEYRVTVNGVTRTFGID